MSDIETIKTRIRKLMAVAGDGVAPEGEIDNALRLVAKLMDAHHLKESDIPTEEDEKDMTMGEAKANCGGRRLATWESTLSNAICNLFGCIKHYRPSGLAPYRVYGVVKTDKSGNPIKTTQISFYGPISEAQEAAELFREWQQSIAAMGVMRWGGCYRGDGAVYCQGFATALYEKSKEINEERQLVQAKPLPGTNCTAITLANRYLEIKTMAKDWLENDPSGPKIKLGSASSRAGYYAGDHSAYSEGRTHGINSGFGRGGRIRANNRLLA